MTLDSYPNLGLAYANAVIEEFRAWVDAVERVGLEEARKVPGFHDEPLKGKLEGCRSIRLNDAYRAYSLRS